jgi:hypothetical protein
MITIVLTFGRAARWETDLHVHFRHKYIFIRPDCSASYRVTAIVQQPDSASDVSMVFHSVRRRISMIFRKLMITTSAASMAWAPTIAMAHSMSHDGHEPILTQPISGMADNYWHDYLTDIGEAEHELDKDLRRATDEEDRRDAVEEYRNEIADANKDYKKEMRERGYRVGRVTLGE